MQAVKEDGTDRWLSYAQYLKETGHDSSAADASEAGHQGATVIPLSAATRSPNCVAELLFSVPRAEGGQAGCVPCTARVRGVLSEGSTYDCELPFPRAGTSSADSRVESSDADLIGRLVIRIEWDTLTLSFLILAIRTACRREAGGT